MTQSELDDIVAEMEANYTGDVEGECPFHRSALQEVHSPSDQRRYYGCAECTYLFSSLYPEEMRKEGAEFHQAFYEVEVFLKERRKKGKPN